MLRKIGDNIFDKNFIFHFTLVFGCWQRLARGFKAVRTAGRQANQRLFKEILPVIAGLHGPLESLCRAAVIRYQPLNQ